MLVSVVFYGIFIYRAWRVVEYDGVLLSPVAAVLLSVIPVVNLVGCFLTFYGLAREMNRVAMRRGATRRPANEGLALAACLCYACGVVVGCIPLIGCLFSPVGLAGMIMWMISMVQLGNIGDRLAAAPPGMPLASLDDPARAMDDGRNPFEPPA